MPKERLPINRSPAAAGSTLLLCLAAVLLVAALAVIRYPKREVEFRNGDATWHVLLTVEAYNETPIPEHLFLPLVNLGGADNKFVPWGSTAQDVYGNRYYTSFSPAGFFFPWLFMRVFHLPVNVRSLYIFNTVLFAAAAVVWIFFLLQVYAGQRERYWLAALGLVIFVMVPELLHGMGFVYWNQSLLQVTLPMQMIAFLRMRKTGSRGASAAFYLLALANPYIEWTGYVANVGFALAGLLAGGKKELKRSFGRALLLGGVTVLSGLLFLLHYSLRTDIKTVLRLMRARSEARSLDGSPVLSQLYHLLDGYLHAFGFVWPLLFVLLVLTLAVRGRLELKCWPVLFLLAFPLLENCIMIGHASSYTYDCMKGIWLVSCLICELSRQLLAGSKRRAAVMAVIGAAALLAGLANVRYYCKSQRYMYPADHREQNRALADYINEMYPDSLLGLREYMVRGYMNLLFGRSIYEYMTVDDLSALALKKGRRYVVYIEANTKINDTNLIYDLTGAQVIDLRDHTVTELSVRDGQVAASPAGSAPG